MGYVRITIHLTNGKKRTGVRRVAEPMNLADIRSHARQLSEETLGRDKIEDVIVVELPADHPDVVAYILRKQPKPIFKSDGTHPYLKEKGLRDLH